MTKDDWRRELRARRRAFVDALDDRAEMERRLAARIIQRFGDAATVAAYLPMAREVDPLPILSAARDRGSITALPHLDPAGGAMRFLRWSPGDPLVAGPHGLRQPAHDADEVRPDLILTPLVGFDRVMRRLGQGAAHYDRAFARLPSARRIGLAWSAQEADALPHDPWDMALHAIVTETEWIEAPR